MNGKKLISKIENYIALGVLYYLNDYIDNIASKDNLKRIEKVYKDYIEEHGEQEKILEKAGLSKRYWEPTGEGFGYFSFILIDNINRKFIKNNLDVLDFVLKKDSKLLNYFKRYCNIDNLYNEQVNLSKNLLPAIRIFGLMQMIFSKGKKLKFDDLKEINDYIKTDGVLSKYGADDYIKNVYKESIKNVVYGIKGIETKFSKGKSKDFFLNSYLKGNKNYFNEYFCGGKFDKELIEKTFKIEDFDLILGLNFLSQEDNKQLKIDPMYLVKKRFGEKIEQYVRKKGFKIKKDKLGFLYRVFDNNDTALFNILIYNDPIGLDAAVNKYKNIGTIFVINDKQKKIEDYIAKNGISYSLASYAEKNIKEDGKGLMYTIGFTKEEKIKSENLLNDVKLLIDKKIAEVKHYKKKEQIKGLKSNIENKFIKMLKDPQKMDRGYDFYINNIEKFISNHGQKKQKVEGIKAKKSVLYALFAGSASLETIEDLISSGTIEKHLDKISIPDIDGKEINKEELLGILGTVFNKYYTEEGKSPIQMHKYKYVLKELLFS